MENLNPTLHRYLLKVWYVGTNFNGSQRQKNKRTVEGVLIQVLIKTGYILTDQQGFFKTAARTDAGVHAREAAFAFSSSKPFFVRELDTNLPDDMGITSWTKVPLEFHPRWEGNAKEYHYTYPMMEKDVLDLSLIREGLEILKGHHNFRLFSKTDNSKPDKETKLTLDEAKLIQDRTSIRFVFRSRSFLWQQIRRTVSFLLSLGRGEKTLKDLQNMLDVNSDLHSKSHRSPPISPQGLILWSMDFTGNLTFSTHPGLLIKKRKYLEQLFIESAQKTNTIEVLFNEM